MWELCVGADMDTSKEEQTLEEDLAAIRIQMDGDELTGVATVIPAGPINPDRPSRAACWPNAAG